MKLSTSTQELLKNFSTINKSILFKEGSTLRTISPTKSVLAVANVEETFDQQAGIYDLSRFLSAYSLYENPELEFGEKRLTISEGTSKTNYTYADPSMIISPPDKDIPVDSPDVEVDVSSELLQKVLKASSVLNLKEVAFVGEGGKCYLKALDSENPTADSYNVEVGKTDDTFCLIIKTEYLNLLPENYKVSILAKGLSRFQSDRVTYFIAVDSKSTFEKGE